MHTYTHITHHSAYVTPQDMTSSLSRLSALSRPESLSLLTALIESSLPLLPALFCTSHGHPFILLRVFRSSHTLPRRMVRRASHPTSTSSQGYSILAHLVSVLFPFVQLFSSKRRRSPELIALGLLSLQLTFLKHTLHSSNTVLAMIRQRSRAKRAFKNLPAAVVIGRASCCRAAV